MLYGILFVRQWRVKLTVFIIIYLYILRDGNLLQSYSDIMAKRIKRSSGRKSTAQRTIDQGREYLELSARMRVRDRRLTGTRTMREIVSTGAAGLRTRGKKEYKTESKKPEIKKRLIKKGRISEVKRAGKTHASKPAKAPRRPASSIPARPTSLALPPVPATIPAISPAVRTGSRASNTGKVAQLSKSKSKDVQIPAFGFIDVCFCVDSTGSMSSQLAQVQEVIKAIISNIEAKVRTEGLQLRFAIVSYRDHPPQDSSYVTQHLDFTDQYEATEYLKTLTAGGGGDEPEAAHDGLMVSAKNLRWAEVDGTPTLRYIFHIADAPPHGSQFNNPEPRTGCLCGMQTDDVIREINKKSIHYRLIKARTNSKLDLMERIFKEKMGNFDSTDIGHARQLNVKVSDMIIHEVLPDYA